MRLRGKQFRKSEIVIAECFFDNRFVKIVQIQDPDLAAQIGLVQ